MRLRLLVDSLKLYNAKDSFRTGVALFPLIAEVRGKGLLDFYHRVVMPTARIVVDLNAQGMLYDVAKRDKAREQYRRQIAEIRHQIAEIAGVPLETPTQLRNLLYHELGVKPLTASKKTGKGSTSKDNLKRLGTAYPGLAPLLDLELEVREYEKLCSTFLSSEPDDDGRLRPSYRIGPTTGRLACKRPNFQNVPEGISRQVFVAPKGKKFVYADFSSADARVFANVAGDDVLLEAFRKIDRGEIPDIHTANAFDLFGIKRKEDVGPKHRLFAKRFFFGHILYGGSIESIQRYEVGVSHGIPAERIYEAGKRYFLLHPAIKHYHERIEREIKTKRMLIGLFGRPRIFFDNPDQAVRQGLNYPCQNGTSDLMNTKMIRVSREIRQLILVLQVHDSLMGEVDSDRADDTAAELKGLLEERVPEINNYSFPASVKIGETWGDF